MVRFRHEAGFVEQFVTLQHQLFVPWTAIEPEGERGAMPTLSARCSVGGLRPVLQPRQDNVDQDRRGSRTMVLPGKIAVPASPVALWLVFVLFVSRETEIADRDRPPRLFVGHA